MTDLPHDSHSQKIAVRLATPLHLLLSLFLLFSCTQSKPSSHAPTPYPTDSQSAPSHSVLFVLTAANSQTLQNGKTRETGYFLNEFIEPYQNLLQSGYSIAFATPGGELPTIDPESLKKRYWRKASMTSEQAVAQVDSLFQHTEILSLETALAIHSQFAGMIIPGGQGVMSDLIDDPQVHQLVKQFAADDRPVGLICHAPAVLARMNPERNPFVGRNVTSVTGIEEWYIETMVMGGKAKIRSIGNKLEKAGLDHQPGFPGRSKAVRDCNLVTSQNPFSGHAFEELYLEALHDWKQGKRCTPS